jgi:methylated-DNA-protein-cysteine methyltransferase-like protein
MSGRGGVHCCAVTETQRIHGKFYAVIRRIPHGRVATYGQIAALAGLQRRARMVGQALRSTPEGLEVPWHRVVNAQGGVSPRSGIGWEEGYQRHLLEEEGVVFSKSGKIDLDRFGWDPEERRPRKSPRG